MTEQTINNFLLINSKYFDMSMMPEVKLLLQNADESMAQSIFAIEFKDPTTLLIISILLGTYGIDDIRSLYTNDVRFLSQFTKES